jgi:hypothetical protein
MDTRFWGPSGWKLLHLIAFSYDSSPEKVILCSAFLETIPYILPCKFCRASLTDYYREHPFQSNNGYIRPELDMGKWMYMIHNCVNNKLRKQDLYPSSNPSFLSVKRFYKPLLQSSWDKQLPHIWDFLFSVGYHHPTEKELYSTPLPECPKDIHKNHDPCERNKWNTLPLKERWTWFKKFWSLLPVVLPSELSEKWEKAEEKHPPMLHTRYQTMNWLWRMRCELDTGFHDPYRAICKRIAMYSSDCSVQKGVFTCRKKTKKVKKSKKRKQTRKTK